MKYHHIDTCFGTHHPQFGYDADNTLWLSGSGPVAGWVNTKVWDETGDAVKAQGWHPFVLDTNANGKVDEWSEPGKPAEAGKDIRIAGSGPYAVMPHPTDGSVWYTTNVFAGTPGFLRFDPKTGLSEFYAIPKEGIGVRGGDIDKNGVLWGSGSNGHLVSFDRSKCKAPLNGPQATGNHCPEGFAFHKYPGPAFEGFENGTGEASYYTWVDHHNTFGLGENVPISTANLNDGFIAFKDGQMVMLRIPYPTGFFAKGLDGRIDDPECRLEGSRLVEHERRPHALADGGRQRLQTARRAHSGAARFTGALSGRGLNSRNDRVKIVVPSWHEAVSCDGRFTSAHARRAGSQCRVMASATRAGPQKDQLPEMAATWDRLSRARRCTAAANRGRRGPLSEPAARLTAPRRQDAELRASGAECRESQRIRAEWRRLDPSSSPSAMSSP
jgi:hypothetical protein